MKVMYRKYRDKDYIEISFQELQRRRDDEVYHKEQDLNIFLIVLDDIDIENNVIYFSEDDAYDY